MIILCIWSTSLVQFSLVLTASKAPRDKSGLMGRRPSHMKRCCQPDVYSIMISMFLQDGPFLALRLMLIFKHRVLSYTNMFFTSKNTLVIILLVYRLIVVQINKKDDFPVKNSYLESIFHKNPRMITPVEIARPKKSRQDTGKNKHSSLADDRYHGPHPCAETLTQNSSLPHQSLSPYRSLKPAQYHSATDRLTQNQSSQISKPQQRGQNRMVKSQTNDKINSPV